MENIELLGFLAGSMIALSSLPQFIKSMKTKSTKDVSILFLIISIIGQILWLTYGVFKDSPSLIVMSFITLCMVSAVFILKIRYDKK